MPGFNAQASLYRTRRLEGYMMTLANANAQGEALVEPQQLGTLSDLRLHGGTTVALPCHWEIKCRDAACQSIYIKWVCNF